MTRIARSFLPIALALGLAACGGQPGGASTDRQAGAAAVSASGVTIDVIATQSWQGGFNGAVRITDTAFAAPISSFEVTFKLAGNAGVGNAWNGAISAPDASGNRTATSPSWLQYQPIRAGQTWDVGFSGTGTFSGATIVAVKINGQTLGQGDAPPTITLAASASLVTPPACVTLTASATDDHGVAGVEFYEGATLLGRDETAPYSLQACPTAAGAHSYTAKAFDTAAQSATSAAVAVQVAVDPLLTLSVDRSVVSEPGCVVLTASGGPAGAVRADFYEGTTLLGSDSTPPFTWQVCYTRVNDGVHAYTVRLLDAQGGMATSAAVSVVVDIPVENGPPTCALAASPTSLQGGGTVTLTATAADDVGVVKVEFYDGATLLAADTAAPYTLAVALTSADAGTHAYTCKAWDAGNLVATSAPVAVVVTIGATPDVTLTVDTSASRRAISPYVYGYNAGKLADAPPGATYLRIGGNRWTAYNWTNNWSNAGQDWGPYSNDTHMGTASQGPGAAITPTIDDARANGLGALVTIPIQGWVSQARSGNVALTDPVASWFIPNVPAKGSAFTLTPSPTSATVYQDELASFVANRWGGAAPHLSLDNEPDLWGYVDASGKGTGTHPEIQRTQLTYAAFLEKSVASATAIKAAVPAALVYGPVSYGWNGMVNFQNAPDAGSASIDDSFLDHYLAAMAAASSGGRRLLDVLDVHWYSEAQSSGCTPSGVRVTNADNSDCVVAARVQAPRSLFDAAFVETSWITQWTTESSAMGKAIQLLPRLQAKVAAKFPGTRLALTEYNHGGEDHVSGAVAQADTLGILGRAGVYAAAFWSVSSTGHDWSYAAWKAFRNYDGSGHHFGDTSVAATTSDLDHVSVYASVDAASPDRLVLVIVHRPTLGSGGALDLKARTVQLGWTHARALRTARAWQLAGGSTPAWKAIAVAAPTTDSVTLTLPALSVTTVELTP